MTDDKKVTTCPDGPFKATIKINFTNGETVATAEYELPPGRLPTEADAVEAAGYVAKLLKMQGLEGFRLQTRHEFVAGVLEDRYGEGVDLAVPGPDEWRIDFSAPLAEEPADETVLLSKKDGDDAA